MTRNLSVWNSLRPFSVGFDSIFEEFDRVLESTERHNSNYPPYNIHKISENDYKIEVALAGYSKDDIELELKDSTLTVRNKQREKVYKKGPMGLEKTGDFKKMSLKFYYKNMIGIKVFLRLIN